MMNVVSKRCNHDGCNKRPTYNKPGLKKGVYCSVHKLEGMMDVKHKRCNHDGCNKIPTFNKPGLKKGVYCSVHKLEGMMDVKHKRCNHDGCNKRPTYNKPGLKKAMYCSVHKLEGMIDVKHKRCKSSWCSIQVKNRYKGYCLFCYIHLFPGEPVSRNYKTKECATTEFIKTTFSELTWKEDQRIEHGCSKRRPDLLLDLGYQVIIIEVDENQHNDYNCSCENVRMLEISRDLGHRPIVFIRFNPDKYIENGKSITSCWGMNKNGFCVVKKSKKKEWEFRLNSLKEQVQYWINPQNKTNKTIEIIQLFYDK